MFISMVALSVADAYDQHQAVWSLFPGAKTRKRDHLYRIESQSNNQVVIILQSTSQPQSSDKATVLQSKPFSPAITTGDYYKFKITANPTQCLSSGKKVVDIKQEAEQVAWLQRKLAGANVTVTSLESQLTKSRKSYTSLFVTFEGVMQVTNAEQISSVLVMGVGRKKHLGAGLLSLAKAS